MWIISGCSSATVKWMCFNIRWYNDSYHKLQWRQRENQISHKIYKIYKPWRTWTYMNFFLILHQRENICRKVNKRPTWINVSSACPQKEMKLPTSTSLDIIEYIFGLWTKKQNIWGGHLGLLGKLWHISPFSDVLSAKQSINRENKIQWQWKWSLVAALNITEQLKWALIKIKINMGKYSVFRSST